MKKLLLIGLLLVGCRKELPEECANTIKLLEAACANKDDTYLKSYSMEACIKVPKEKEDQELLSRSSKDVYEINKICSDKMMEAGNFLIKGHAPGK